MESYGSLKVCIELFVECVLTLHLYVVIYLFIEHKNKANFFIIQRVFFTGHRLFILYKVIKTNEMANEWSVALLVRKFYDV